MPAPSVPPQPEASERLLAGVLAVIDDGVSIVDQDARIVMVNPAYTRHFGWQPADLVGRPFTDRLSEGDRTEALARHHAGLSHGMGYERVGSYRCADGALVPIRTQSVTVEAAGRLFRIERVSPLAGAPRRVVAGKLQVVGLDRARDALGARWPLVRDRALATAEDVLRQRLGPADALSRTEDGWVVRFAELSEEEAGFAAAELSDEVTRRLSGEVAEASSRAVGFAAEVELPEDGAAVPEEDGQAVVSAVQRKLADTRRAMVRGARSMLAHAVDAARLGVEPVFDISGKRAPLLLGRVAAGLDRRLERLAEHGWDDDGTDLAVELALLRVGLACGWLAGEGAGVSAPLALSLPFDAVSRRAALGRVADMCRELPEPLRGRLVVELRGAMPDTPRHRLCEAVQTLAPVVRGVAVELPGTAHGGLLDNLGSNLHLVSLHADAALPQGPDRTEALTALVSRLAQQKLRLLVRGVRTEDAWVALYPTGVAWVSGPALGTGDPG